MVWVGGGMGGMVQLGGGMIWVGGALVPADMGCSVSVL